MRFKWLIILACLTVVLTGRILPAAEVSRGFSIPQIDLSDDLPRQVIVDREQGQYLEAVSKLGMSC